MMSEQYSLGVIMETLFSFTSALISGIVATAAVTLFTYMAPLMGFEMNIPKMLAGIMGVPVVIGWIAHFTVSVILAINYATIFLNRNKNLPILKAWQYLDLSTNRKSFLNLYPRKHRCSL